MSFRYNLPLSPRVPAVGYREPTTVRCCEPQPTLPLPSGATPVLPLSWAAAAGCPAVPWAERIARLAKPSGAADRSVGRLECAGRASRLETVERMSDTVAGRLGAQGRSTVRTCDRTDCAQSRSRRREAVRQSCRRADASCRVWRCADVHEAAHDSKPVACCGPASGLPGCVLAADSMAG